MIHIVFQASRILVTEQGGLYLPSEVPPGARDPHGGQLHLGAGADGIRVTLLAEDAPPPAGTVPQGLRSALPLLDDEALWKAGRARQLLEWRENHRHCGRCGAVTELGDRGASLTCPRCGLSAFPRVSPAVIVLVHDEDRILLGRAHRFPPGMYSTLAGFVEPGESAEDALRREVREESGVEVEDLRYFGSQPWPFPHSLMLGFHARYAGGGIRTDETEMEDVRWFTAADLPELPTPVSIARRLIDAYLSGWAGLR